MTDLERILALPRRPEYAADLSAEMTRYCAKPGVTPPFNLYHEQAIALVEAVDARGLVMAAVVGSGKTLVIFLLPTLLDAKKPLVIVPAHLREKTSREWYEYSQHWNLIPPIIKSYTEISRDKNEDGKSLLLETLAPDVILCDEGHHLSNLDAGCTKKVMRYLENHPNVVAAFFSGTVWNHSLMDGWHTTIHALGQGSPLPIKKSVAQAWAQAVDPGTNEEIREKAAKRAGLDELGYGDVRAVLRERIQNTPGYVTSTAKYDGPLEIARTRHEPPEECRKALADVELGLRPDGLPIDAFDRLGVVHPHGSDAAKRTILARWHLSQTLFLGYWDKPDPEPPAAWVLARANWQSIVEESLALYPDLDTPEAVQFAVERGRIPAKNELRAWLHARESYKYSTRAEWLTRKAPVLCYAADWLRENARGLVWVPSASAGKIVCQLAGYSPQTHFFGAAQGTGDAPVIEQHKDRAVVTIGANKSGRNLQHGWNDNLLLQTPSLSGVHDQILGRTHRPGQRHTVTAEYARGLPAHDNAWAAALDNAEFVAGITGDTPKLLLANHHELTQE